jgi:signal transduction histidine kinase
VADLEAGRWQLGRESYAWYASKARTFGGLPPAAPTGIKLAVAETVEALWAEWQLFQRSGVRSLTKRVYRHGRVSTLTVLNATTERLVALIHTDASIRDMARRLASARGAERLVVSLVDEQGDSILGEGMPVRGEVTTRSLSAAGLPWQVKIAAVDEGDTDALLAARRSYFIAALGVIVALVSAASYAMARGVLREAAAGRLQSDFVSAVSHEFRSPLTTLRQLTELLAHGRIQDESRRRLYFEVLQRETSRLQQLVENLLDFGRMDAGRQQYRLAPLELSALVRESIDEYEAEAGANGHTIALRAEHSPIVVDADREALKRVVRNLLENAIKYSPDSPTVWVETAVKERAAVLRVRDAGVGVLPEERSRIFEKFVRGEAAKRACIQGTGIGLAMVKEIVRAHQGAVDVESEPGRGSTFLVRLPLRAADCGGVP